MKKLFKKLLNTIKLLFIWLVVALVFGEIFIRIFMPQQESMKWYLSDEKYGYVMKKNFSQDYHYINTDVTMHVRTNSLGLRDAELTQDQLTDEDLKRVLLIGDSFVFGYGVNEEDHFKTFLQKDLDTNFLVVNAGVGGWGTFQELNYARDHFNVFNPQVVVLSFCANDPEDDLEFSSDMSDNEKGAINFPAKTFIKHNSHFYRFAYYHLHTIVHRAILKEKLKETDKQVDKQSAGLIGEEEWDRTFTAIQDFYVDFREFNSDGTLIIQATAPWNEDIRDHIAAFCKGKEGLVFNDLYQETVELPEDRRRLPFDGHWSKELHVIVANSLTEIISGL